MKPFSTRLPWEQTPNLFTKLLQENREQSIPLVDLTESNPTQVGLFSSHNGTWLDSLCNPNNLQYQPNSQGLWKAREAIAQDYQLRGFSPNPHHLVLCASTSEAYSWLFQLLCNANQEVLCPRPSYPLFEHLAQLSLVHAKPYDLFYEDRWRLQVASLQQAVTPHTKAVIAVHPNNPTGSFLEKAEAHQLLGFCREHQLALIVDEVFLDYGIQPHPLRASSFVKEAKEQGVLCFVLSGLSKVLGMPQLKLGWICVMGPEPLRSQAQQGLEWIADTFLSVNTPVQWALPTLLSQRTDLQQKIHQRLSSNLLFLQQKTHDTACQILQAEGGWSAIVRLPNIMTEEEWVLLFLQEDHILCYPGHFFELPEEPYVIISLLVETHLFQEGVMRLVGRVSQTG